MIATVGALSGAEGNPHIRQMDGRRDGHRVADLLELAFRDEPFDENGRRLLYMLRHYGPFEAAMMRGSTSFVWEEDGLIVGNVSLQQSVSRKDTWVIGNVATHPNYRRRGVSTALMTAAIAHARRRNGRFAALQVVDGNAPAARIYDRLGFARMGVITHYQRSSVHMAPVSRLAAPDTTATVRKANRRDRDFVWRTVRHNVPDELTYAEPFDPAMYRLGLRWWLANAFNGSRELWHVLVRDGRPRGAARSRANFDLADHHLELMLEEGATTGDGVLLLEAALGRLERYVGKPVYSAQPRPHEPTHAALQTMGFRPTRTLAHMRLAL